MYFIRKLKPPQFSAEFTVVFLLMLVVLVTSIFWGLRGTWGAIAIIEFISAILQLNLFIKTKNSAFLWLIVALFLIVIFATNISVFGMTKDDSEFVPLALGVVLGGAIILIIVLKRKTKWKTRELLELAAMPVSETRNGFTERPLPIAKIDGTKKEIEAFALFLSMNLIALPYEENGKIFFSLTSSYWKQIGLLRGYSDESWVSFDEEGNVNVFVTKKDYLQYRDAFSFDQLCTTLGNLFIEFFEMFKHGDGIRILDRLNSLKLNPLIE